MERRRAYGNHEVDKRAFIYRQKEVKVLGLSFLRKHLPHLHTYYNESLGTGML